MEIDVRITPLRHPVEDRVHIVPARIDNPEPRLDGFLVSAIRRLDQPRYRRQHRARARLDRHMHQHEPSLVLSGEEVLDHPDIVEPDRRAPVQPVPVVEHIGRVGQQRLLSQPLRQLPHRHGQLRRQHGRRIRLAPHICLHHERVPHHRAAKLRLRSPRAERAQVQHGQGLQMLPHPPRQQRPRQVLRRLFRRRQVRRQRHIRCVISAKKSPFRRHIVVG